MPGDIRPLRLGSLGKTKIVSRTRFTYPVVSGPNRTRVARGTMTLEGRLDPGFQRLLRDRGRFTKAMGDVNRTHGSMAFGAISRVYRELNENVKANPRPNRQGREGLRSTLRNRHEDLMSVNMANAANAGFIVDFNRLDEIGPFDAQGRPYWRFVDQGFGGGQVEALFADDGGFSAPSGARRFRDPRMPNLPRGALFEISGFEGYNFIGPTIKEYAGELRRSAFELYLADLDWPDEVRDAAISFMAGGSDRGGRVRAMSGRFMRDFRSF